MDGYRYAKQNVWLPVVITLLCFYWRKARMMMVMMLMTLLKVKMFFLSQNVFAKNFFVVSKISV